MNERAQVGLRRRIRLLGAVMATALFGGSLVATGTAGLTATAAGAAPTPIVSVSPSTGANAAGQVLAVSGSGVSTTANGGIGIYVAFGPNPDLLPADKWVNAEYYQNVAYTHPGGTGTTTNKNLETDGTFSYNLTHADGSPLTALYTTSTGTYDCTQISCGILTFTAHGVPDRTQDTFTPVSFAPAVSTSSLPFTNRTQAYSQTLSAIGGTAPYTWSVASGALPAGLSLSSSGVISGSTTAAVTAGTYDFTAQAIDSSPSPLTATKALSILVKTPTVTVTPSTDADPNGQAFTVTGSGFNPNAPVPGSPSGTGSYVAFGPNPASLPASPAFYAGTGYYQVAVWARLSPPSVTDGQKAMNADGTFSFTFTTGGTPRLLTAQYTAPNGTYDCEAIQCGILTFRSQGNADRSQDTFTPVSFTVPPTEDPANAKVGVPYNTSIAPFEGVGPYTWKVQGKLPPGLTLNPSTGQVTGTPTTEGKFTATVRVTDSATPRPVKVSTKLKILVAPVAITIATASLPGGTAGVAYSQTLSAAGGVGPYRFKRTDGALPAKVKLSRDGIVSGAPKAAGTYTCTVQVTDKFKFTASRTYTLVVG